MPAYDPSAQVCRFEPGEPPEDDSLQQSQLDDTVRASAAARQSAVARARPPPEERTEPGPDTSDAGEDRPRLSDSGAPVASTRVAADRATEATVAAAQSHSNGALLEGSAIGTRAVARGQGQAAADQERQRQQTLDRLARPPARPTTGGSQLGRDSIFIDVRARPFQASRAVPVPAFQRPATGKDGKPVADPETSPAAAATAFGGAVGAAEALYTELLAAARQLAVDAASENARAADRSRNALDRELSDLTETLKRNQVSLDRAQDFAIDKVRAWAATMGRRINRAAATAFGRLSEMREVYEGLMTRPRERRARVERELRTALSETNAKSNAAHSANQAFASRPDGRLTTADFDGDSSSAIARAKLEAALQFIVPYINAADRATAERQGVIEGALNPMRDCLPCQMDGAFQLLDRGMNHLAVAGPRAGGRLATAR
jgi:hypothetical protein